MSDAMTHTALPEEGDAMSLASSSTSYLLPTARREEFKVSLLFGALFPLFLAAAVIPRALPFATERGAPAKSAIGEARENLSIAISYALMARAMLQSFARE
ncbi:hypothetical protein [Methylocystis parvus]|uniref:hypothetical protein n=1 Tax=Methylocystis parvus TaxID=134 RepID=UPI003C75FEC5